MAKKSMFGPDFSLDEIPYWVGFTAGLVIVGLTLQQMQVHRLVLLLGALGGGVVVGMIFEYLWRTMMKQPPQGPPPGPPANDQRVSGGG
jgi:hypothetical protein